MNVVRFPRAKLSTSPELRNSQLAKPTRRLVATVVVDGSLADTITVAAGNAQITTDALIVRSLRALFGGGTAA